MCGIVYSKSWVGKPVNKTIIKRYTDQKHRGTDGFGFYIPQSNRLTHNIKEGRILSLLKRDRSSEVLFHHRFPTSTVNVRNACHPFSTKDYFKNNYVVVHNGVLRNEDDLQKEHKKLGIKYVSEQKNGQFNDSEALAYDLARYFEGEVKELTATGNIAFIAIKRNKRGTPTELLFGRNTGNPLRMKRTRKSITLSSEGDGVMITPNKLYRLNYKTKVMTVEDFEIPVSTYSTYGGYLPPYTPAKPVTPSVPYADNKPTVYGEYSGYRDGYDWDPSEDREQSIIDGRTSLAAEFTANEIMTDAGDDITLAVQLAEMRINAAEVRIERLEEMSNDLTDNGHTDTEAEQAVVNEYIELDEQLSELREALEILQIQEVDQSLSGVK